MDFKELKLEIKDNIGIITMNMPDKLNPFTVSMGEEFVQALYECEYSEDVRCVVLTGAGRAFSAGGDIQGMSDAPDDRKGFFFKEIAMWLHAVIIGIRRIPKPVIAAVNGVASGAGFSLALACDLIYAAEGARFNLAYLNVGLHPDGGATFFLPRLIGVHKTRELVFTGKFLNANEAADLNIVNKVTSAEELENEVLSLAKKLASGPTFAMGLAKESIDKSLQENLEGQLENERQALCKTGVTEDLLEGIKAFLEKRKPVFQGK